MEKLGIGGMTASNAVADFYRFNTIRPALTS